LYHFEDFRKKYFRRVANGENPYKEVITNENAPKVLYFKIYMKYVIFSLENLSLMLMKMMNKFTKEMKFNFYF